MSATHLYCFQVGWAWASWAAACAPPGAPWLSGVPCPLRGAVSLCAMIGSLLDEVDEGEDRDPDHVDEVPVERRDVDVDRVTWPEPALVVDRQQRAKPDHTGSDVGAVEPGEREERRPEQVGSNRQPFVHERRELVGLKAEERRSENARHPQPQLRRSEDPVA